MIDNRMTVMVLPRNRLTGLGRLGFPGEGQQFTQLVTDLQNNDLNAVLKDIVIHNQPPGLQDSDIPSLIPQYASAPGVQSWLGQASAQARGNQLVNPPWPQAGPFTVQQPLPPQAVPVLQAAPQQQPTPYSPGPTAPTYQPQGATTPFLPPAYGAPGGLSLPSSIPPGIFSQAPAGIDSMGMPVSGMSPAAPADDGAIDLAGFRVSKVAAGVAAALLAFGLYKKFAK